MHVIRSLVSVLENLLAAKLQDTCTVETYRYSMESWRQSFMTVTAPSQNPPDGLIGGIDLHGASPPIILLAVSLMR